MRRYYDKEGNKNEEAFSSRLSEIHAEIENGIDDLSGLLKVRNKLYRLKSKYEECGLRYLECEYEILALNEIIQETRV